MDVQRNRQDEPHPSLPIHQLSRQSSRGRTFSAESLPARPSSPPPRPVSPVPKGGWGKPSFLARLKLSQSSEKRLYQDDSDDELPPAAAEDRVKTPRKSRGKGKEKWNKRASRKAPSPPRAMRPRREESEELDWERIKTLPRVRLVPPEDEGEPVMLYPIPHPSSLLPPALPEHTSPPTLLAATVAATLVSTDPTAPPPVAVARPTSPPAGVVPNSLAHATFMAESHGHWIGMSDKFILPPPIFSRSPQNSSGRPALRGVVMPKTKRQVEADIGRRMSMVEQRKRDSMESDRNILLPPLEEATQSPPNIMLPPLSEVASMFELELGLDGGGKRVLSDEEDDEPLAMARNRIKQTSPPRARPMSPARSIQIRSPTSPPRARPASTYNTSAIPVRRSTAPAVGVAPPDAPALVHAVLDSPFQPTVRPTRPIESPPTPVPAPLSVPIDDTPPIPHDPDQSYDMIDPEKESVFLPNPHDHAPQPTNIQPQPIPVPTPIFTKAVLPVADAQPVPTRTKRSKSLSAALSRAQPEEAPAPAMPKAQTQLKAQKSLKKLFFPGLPEPEALPAVPAVQIAVNARQSGDSLEADEEQAMGRKEKRSLLSRVKSKPSLQIEVKPTRGVSKYETDSDTPSTAGFPLTPALPSATSSKASRSTTPVGDASSPLSSADPSIGGGAIKKGLSKRFSLSNMSGAFRKKASISGSIPTLPPCSAGEVPMVPVIPEMYRTSPRSGTEKGKKVEKGRKILKADGVDQPKRGRSFELVRHSLVVPERKASAGPILGSANASVSAVHLPHPHSRSPREEVNEINLPNPHELLSSSDLQQPPHGTPPSRPSGLELQSDVDGLELETDFEFASTVSPVQASSEAGVRGSFSFSNTISPPAAPISSRNISRSFDIETASLNSLSSLSDGDDDEVESTSIIHAHLMQVSPATKRNPGNSLQEFMGTAPLRGMGVLVSEAEAGERRKSVQAIIQGPLLLCDSPSTSATRRVDTTPEAQEETKRFTACEKGKGRMVVEDGGVRMAAPMVIDLRGQYLKRLNSLEAAANSQSPDSTSAFDLIRRSPATVIQPKAAGPVGDPTSPPINAEAVTAPGPVIKTQESLESLTHSSASEAEPDTVPVTPSLLALNQILSVPDAELEAVLDLDTDPQVSPLVALPQPIVTDVSPSPAQRSPCHSSDSDSDLVIVESPSITSLLLSLSVNQPLPTSYPASLKDESPASSKPASTRSKFTPPDALLRLLASPRASGKMRHSGIPAPSAHLREATAVREIEGLPRRLSPGIADQQEAKALSGAEVVNSTVGAGVIGSVPDYLGLGGAAQLGSLHFDGLGLNLDFDKA